jgi:hypothetical protein
VGPEKDPVLKRPVRGRTTPGITFVFFFPGESVTRQIITGWYLGRIRSQVYIQNIFGILPVNRKKLSS